MLEYITIGLFGVTVIIELYNSTLGKLNNTRRKFLFGEITTE